MSWQEEVQAVRDYIRVAARRTEVRFINDRWRLLDGGQTLFRFPTLDDGGLIPKHPLSISTTTAVRFLNVQEKAVEFVVHVSREFAANVYAVAHPGDEQHPQIEVYQMNGVPLWGRRQLRQYLTYQARPEWPDSRFAAVPIRVLRRAAWKLRRGNYEIHIRISAYVGVDEETMTAVLQDAIGRGSAYFIAGELLPLREWEPPPRKVWMAPKRELMSPQAWHNPPGGMRRP